MTMMRAPPEGEAALMDALILDIETLPLEPQRKALEWRSASDKRLGDYLSEHASGSHAIKPGLHPLFSEVAVISGMSEGEILTLDSVSHGGERGILETFANPFRRYEKSLLVTYNGMGFDVPMLAIRAAYHGVKFPSIRTNKWRNGEEGHLDLMQLLSGNGTWPFVSLEIACLAFGVEVPIPSDGSTRKDLLDIAQDQFRKGNPDLLRARCESDVRMTAGLYERVRGR